MSEMCQDSDCWTLTLSLLSEFAIGGYYVKTESIDAGNDRIGVFKANANIIKNVLSPNQNLNFAQLRICYEENGLDLNDQFPRTLDLMTEDG